MISVVRTARSSARSCFPGTNKEQRILEKRHTKEKTNILDPLKLNVPQYQVRLLSCRQSQSRAAGSKAECSPKRLVVSFAKSKNLFICLCFSLPMEAIRFWGYSPITSHWKETGVQTGQPLHSCVRGQLLSGNYQMLVVWTGRQVRIRDEIWCELRIKGREEVISGKFYPVPIAGCVNFAPHGNG